MRQGPTSGSFLRRLVACAGVAWCAAATPASATEYLVTDQVGDRIVAFDAATGGYTRTLWTSSERVQPSAMSYGPGGDLYFANRLSGEVLRIDREDLGGTNVTAAPFATVAFPGSMTYHAATDSLLVGEFGVYPGGPLGDEIIVYNGAGAVQATLTLPQVGIAGLAFDAAGDLYASGFFTTPAAAGRIYKFRGPPTWESLGPFAPDPYPYPELQGAAGIAFDADGDMLVAGLITANAGAIVKFDLEGGELVGQERLGEFIPFPSGMLMVDDGQLLVTSLGFGPTSGSVYRVNPETGARSILLGGDFNEDGVVDPLDFTQWQTSFGVDALADADFDGDTDGNDFLALQRGFGRTTAPDLFSPSAFVVYDAPSASSGVPEPAAATLAVAVLAALTVLRRQRILSRLVSSFPRACRC
jgi:hypothetical protein